MTEIISFDLAVFLAGTFVTSFVTGAAGFAFGIVAASFWVYALEPAETATLTAAYAILVQGYAVWTLRHRLDPQRLWPFLLGSAVGIPGGVALMTMAAPLQIRFAIGVLLVLFSTYNLARPKLPEFRHAGPRTDLFVGVLNGMLGGSTGLGGILPAIWCGLRGWPRDEQRAVFQPTAVATFLMMIAWFGGAGVITVDIVRLFAIGLPMMAAGTALGWMTYNKLNEITFRKTVLVLLLLSGVVLVVAGR